MKKKTKLILFFITLFIIVLGIVIYYFYNQKDIIVDNNSKINKTISEIKEYGYVLDKNETKEYKDRFKKLSEILKEKPVNEERYVSLITEMFIIDFYTLSDKLNKNDIGGIQFIHNDLKNNFILQAKETIYKYIENNPNSKNNNKLPTIKQVNIKNIEKTVFTYNNTDPNSYKVTVEWSYKEDLGYQSAASIIFMHEDKKLSIVELN